MRCYLVIFFLLLIPVVHAQDIAKLENDLANTSIYDFKKVREKADRIYLLDALNETATYYLTTAYLNTGNNDSADALYERLKKTDPLNPKPYLMQAKYQYNNISLEDTQRLFVLKKAIRLDSTIYEAYYLLGASYYALFNKRPSPCFAARCRANLEKAIQIDTKAATFLKYPVIQTSCYLGDSITANNFRNMATTVETDSMGVLATGDFYFPFHMFLEVKNGWEEDFTQDVWDEMYHTSFVLRWYSGNLRALEEPVLYTQRERIIYRFTWLRSFNNPVAIRLEKKGDTYNISWKVADGAGGYDPGKIVINESKRITLEQWNTFLKLLSATDFWEMPVYAHTAGVAGFDGARWIIEGMQNKEYHVVDRWTPKNTNYGKCGLYLVELTGMKIKNSELY